MQAFIHQQQHQNHAYNDAEPCKHQKHAPLISEQKRNDIVRKLSPPINVSNPFLQHLLKVHECNIIQQQKNHHFHQQQQSTVNSNGIRSTTATINSVPNSGILAGTSTSPLYTPINVLPTPSFKRITTEFCDVFESSSSSPAAPSPSSSTASPAESSDTKNMNNHERVFNNLPLARPIGLIHQQQQQQYHCQHDNSEHGRRQRFHLLNYLVENNDSADNENMFVEQNSSSSSTMNGAPDICYTMQNEARTNGISQNGASSNGRSRSNNIVTEEFPKNSHQKQQQKRNQQKNQNYDSTSYDELEAHFRHYSRPLHYTANNTNILNKPIKLSYLTTEEQNQYPIIFPSLPKYQQPGYSTLLTPTTPSSSSSPSESLSFSSSSQSSSQSPSPSPLSSDIQSSDIESGDKKLLFTDEQQTLTDYNKDLSGDRLIHDRFHHLTLEEKKRFERLFRELDLDRNGYIDFNDLVEVLKKKGIRASSDNVKQIIGRQDHNRDGDVDFADFVNYCLETEQKLHVLFKNIDENNDGKIDITELINAFEQIGVNVKRKEAYKLVSKIKNKRSSKGSFELNFEEFRDYLLLHPTGSIKDLLHSWRLGSFVDLGEDGIMPVDFKDDEKWFLHLVAGAFAGGVSRTCTAPLDRLKVFLQVRGSEFSSLVQCFKYLLREGGLRSLWRGNGINVVKIIPESGLKFAAYDEIKRRIYAGDVQYELSTFQRFIAGSAAGAFAQTVVYPLEVMKTRMTLRKTGEFPSARSIAATIFGERGVPGFFRGYIPNVLGIIPYAGIDLALYETLKSHYDENYPNIEPPITICLGCGTISSLSGQIATYPLVLVRTRLQAQTDRTKTSIFHMFRTIVKNEGVMGLYRGMLANMLKVVPAVAISYTVYEAVRRPLGADMH